MPYINIHTNIFKTTTTTPLLLLLPTTSIYSTTTINLQNQYFN